MRKIDGKHHLLGENIIKSSNGEPIAEDEPLFLFRGRDRLAVATLETYARLCKVDGCLPEHVEAVNESIERFKRFRQDKPLRMKQPGVTRGL